MAGRGRRSWLLVLLGLVLGFTLASRLILPRAGDLHRAAHKRRASPETCGVSRGVQGATETINPKPSSEGQKFLFVGVMTAKKYLQSRAVAAHRTWAQTIPGRVEFFSSEGSTAPPPAEAPAAAGGSGPSASGGSASSSSGSAPSWSGSVPLPVVALKGVDDSYPPQKKSFMMLKYMHDHFLSSFEWFMRADDDVYIKGAELESFLRSLNSSRPLLLGQTGMGARDELGKLALEPGENFCMGGPGVIFSRELLRRLVPHISSCLRNMYTTHEDVEVGRCVRRVTGTQCVWSYEMQQLFYENYEPNKRGYIRDLRSSKIHRALTLHPNKSPPHQFRLHAYVLTRRLAALRRRTVRLHREALSMSRLLGETPSLLDAQLGAPPSFTRFSPRRRQHVLEWDFLTGRHVMSSGGGAPPRRALEAAARGALEELVQQLMEAINANAKARGRLIDFKEVQYGYRRVDPAAGAQYVLDLLLLYRRHKGPSLAVPVRRHAYLQQSFSRPELREQAPLGDPAALAAAIDRRADARSFLSLSLQRLVPFQSAGASAAGAAVPPQRRVHILVPLAGRLDTLRRFLAHVERVCLRPALDVQLLLLLFGQDNHTARAHELVHELRRRYPRALLQVQPVGGAFSRARALQQGAAALANDSLLFFCDVDLLFSADFLQRCRDNTAPGHAYFPVIFSQYDPRVVGAAPPSPPPSLAASLSLSLPLSPSPFALTSHSGGWRSFGFGVACMLRSDLLTAGGFDTSIRGWGLEDVDLFSRVVGAGVSTLRAADPGVVHVHHPVRCDPRLEPRQLTMCRGSRAASYGAPHRLAELWLHKQQQSRTNGSWAQAA